MRRSLRFLLLAMGCVVMVATSPVDPPYGQRVVSTPLVPGRAETFVVEAGAPEGKDFVVPRVHLSVQAPEWQPDARGRVIGIVSPDAPTGAGYDRLDPRGTFTVGQEVEGLGTVAFVHEVPFDTRGADGQGSPWVLPEARGYYLTLMAQGAQIELEMSMPYEELQSQCGCEVEFGFEYYNNHFYFPAFEPDGGEGGHDGG